MVYKIKQGVEFVVEISATYPLLKSIAEDYQKDKTKLPFPGLVNI